MATRTPEADVSDELLSEFGANASYVPDLPNRFRRNPASVDDEWRRYFRERFGEPESRAEARPAAVSSGAPAPAPAPAPARSVPAEPATKGPALEGERVPIRGAAARIAENMEA